MSTSFVQSEATAARRRFPVYLVDATDGLTAETGEAGGQPQVSKNGGAWANTTATLTAVGNGKYYVELSAAELSDAGMVSIRYKSANTAEFSADAPVTVFNTHTANVTLAAATHTGAVIPTVTAVTNDVGITQAGADKVWSTTTRAITDKVGFSLSAAGVQAIWDALTSALTVVGSIGKRLADNVDAVLSTRSTQSSVDAISSRLPAGLIGGRIDATVGAMQTAVLTDNALDTTAANEVADALINRNIAGGSSTGRLVRDVLRFFRNRKEIVAGTLTVYQEDDVTTAWTGAVTTAAGNPVTGIDPT